MKIRDIVEKWKDLRFWFRKTFIFPVIDFILNNFNWVSIEGQMFRRNEDELELVWNGKYNKKTSRVKRDENKSIFKQFEHLENGTVFFCDYIWGVDGKVRKVRFVEVVIDGDELVKPSSSLNQLDECFYE